MTEADVNTVINELKHLHRTVKAVSKNATNWQREKLASVLMGYAARLTEREIECDPEGAFHLWQCEPLNYAGYIEELQEIIHQIRRDELLRASGTYEEYVYEPVR